MLYINWNSQFLFKGMLGSIFHFYSNFNKTLFKQTVETLIRRRVLRCLVRVCTICLRPTKWTQGLNGLTWNQLIKCKRQMTYINASIEYSQDMWIRTTPIQPHPPPPPWKITIGFMLPLKNSCTDTPREAIGFVLFYLRFYVPVNGYGHVETVDLTTLFPGKLD